MAPRWTTIAILVLMVVGTVLAAGSPAAAHPFEDAKVSYTVKVADNRPDVASDLGLTLRFAAPAAVPEPFGSIVHRAPGAWRLAADEGVPDGDGVGHLFVALGKPHIKDPKNVCADVVVPPFWLKVALVDASSDSSAPDYPPFLPAGDHKARWTGRVEMGEKVVPVNVLMDARKDAAPGDRLQLFVGRGDGLKDLPELDKAALDACFSLTVSLNVAGQSSSGVPVAVNPKEPGKYLFISQVTSKPDPTDAHDHTITLKAHVFINGGPAGYKVDVRDHNPAVATDLVMALNFRPESSLPRPFGGITHRAPAEWGIASDEAVPDGDGVARLHLRLNVPPTLKEVCPSVLPARPSLAITVPLRDASSDSSAPDYPPFLPPGEHKARWAGMIGKPDHAIPVNVLVDEKSSGGTAMQVFVGRGLYHINVRPLPKCVGLDVVLHVAGKSSSGVPVAVNPEAEGTYTFNAHIDTLPKPHALVVGYDLQAEVVIEESPKPEPCSDCKPGDVDGDGIPDEKDLCAEEPEDLDDHDTSDGCPDSGDDDKDELPNLVELLIAADPANQDSDSDGCTDGAETQPDASLGGQRDPSEFWDFFDPNLDRSISAGDFFAVLSRFGAEGDTSIDPLTEPPPAPGYHTVFDRSPLEGALSGPPDGAVAAGDFFLVLGQFGHECR